METINFVNLNFINLFISLLLSAALVTAEHLAVQLVARELPGSKLGLWARYVMGCAAILAGLFLMLSFRDWLMVAGLMAWSGLVTAAVTGAIRWWKVEQRMAAAEQAHDDKRRES